MSSKHPALSEERQKAVFDEFVNMYIKNGGIYPTARDIKKNPYITEEEVAILRKKHLLDDRDVRAAAERKTGKKYKTQQELHKERTKEAMTKMAENNRAKKIQEGIVEAAKRAQEKEEVNTVQKTEKEKKPKAPVRRINEEAVKKALHDFAVENLRWPTRVEITQFYKEKRPGWEASQQWISIKLGTSDDWRKLLFPDGLPEGFIAHNGGGKRQKGVKKIAPQGPNPKESAQSKSDFEKPLEYESLSADEFKERLQWINDLIVAGALKKTLNMTTDFSMKSSAMTSLNGRDLYLTFEVK